MLITAGQWDHPQDTDDDGGAAADGGDDDDGGAGQGNIAPATLPGIASFLLRGRVVQESKDQKVWI